MDSRNCNQSEKEAAKAMSRTDAGAMVARAGRRIRLSGVCDGRLCKVNPVDEKVSAYGGHLTFPPPKIWKKITRTPQAHNRVAGIKARTMVCRGAKKHLF
jgi:hypothetical protein